MSTIKPKVREALKRGQFTEVNDDEVDYEFTSPSQFFSQNLTLLPMISTVQSQRQFYTDKFFNQALPLVHGEAPLVRSLKDEKTGETFESYIGNQTGVVRAEDDDDGATITDVSPDYIKYKTKAGDIKTRSIYNNLAFNRKTYVTNTPLVKKGDTIKKGQLLAKTNYTDNEGNLNMGLNARIAVVPYKGWSFEDAVVISEDFAKRLASQHMYSMSQDFSSADERKNTTTNRDHFTSLFPKKFTKDQLTNIDENGVVKVGTVVKHGDPLILATRPRMVSSKDSDLGRLSKYLGKTRTDASLAWEHEADGVVTDVVKTKHGWKVNVRSEQPARPGDKLSIGRSGSKGTISKIIPQNLVPRTLDGRPVDVLFNPLGIPCYSSDTEILTDKGWISVVEADGSYKYMTLNPDTWCMELQEASHIHHYDYNGPMYHLETRQLSLLTTPNHNQFVMKRGKRGSTSPIDLSDELKHKELFNLIESKDVLGKTFKYLKAAKWVGVDPVTIEIPEGTKGKTGTVAPGFTVTSEQWAEFMGWFLSEGYTTINKGKKGNSYIVGICQSSEVNPEKYERIKSLLDDMGVNYFIRPREFVISHKGLYEKLEPLGKCRDKYIPQEILQMTPELLNVFLKSLFAGDGNCYTNLKTGHVDVLSYTTSSKKLIDGVQEVYAKLGRICNIKREKRRGEQACYYATIQKGDAGSWINWSDKTKTQQIEEWADYDGQVHCVTVPNGIVFVRRNGKAVFSGNSRVNANLIMSMMLGKVADKTGKPIKIKSFNNRDEKWYEYVENLMKEHNITDVEDLYDPEKDRLLDNPVTVGNDYIIKMHHTAESKFSARGAGPVYTSDEQPARGGDEGLGCFVAGQTITSMYGPIDIGTVCERKMRIPVMSFDFDKREWCFKNITNWFTYRAKPEDIITVRFCTNAFRKIGMPFKLFNPAAMHVTKNHKVFRKDGSKVAIGDLNVGDKLYTYGPVPTDDQYALLYGTMLGDGYAHKDEDSIRIEHSYSQINYIKWKHSVLSGLLSRTYDHIRERNSKSSLVQKPFRSTSLTLSYPYLCKEIRQLCYSSEGRKTVTKEWLDKLTPLSIAVLIADDGCIYWSNTGHKCGLNLFMYSFTQEENEMLAARIKELTGIEFHLNNGYRYDGKNITKVYEAGLMCAYKKEDIIKAAKLILQYIPLDCLPQAKRSSIKRCLNIQDDRDYVRTIDVQPKIDLIPVEITSIEQYKPEKPNVTEINVYDFTVEDTHTYLAGNVLVSNSKQYSGLENNGIFSAGAYEIAKDAIHVRGQKNDDYWRAVRNGETPTLAKKSPFVWDKYIALMQGAGINTIDRGNGILQASPFTDRQFKAMNPKELDNPYIVDLNNMKPVVGGLFDPTNSLTDRWGKITLNEPYPNPGFEDAIANLLGLKKSEMYKVMTGEKDLNGKVGTKALQSALKSIDMDKMMDEAKQQFKHGPKSLKQKALNTMRYIKGLKVNGLTPDELMITMVPVLPSKFRPYSAMGDTFIPGDANELYKDVFQMRNAQKQLEDELGPEEAMQNSMNMYASIKALYGFGDSLNKKIQQRGVSGFLDKLVGGTSKFSYLNRHVNAKPVDLTARSVIDVDPDLGMNEIGLPTRMAYTLFGPYIQQKLVQWGMSPAQAVEAIAREQEHLNK